jgi:hypothetical protein
MIVGDQSDALIDQPIAIALRGFTPHQPMSLTAMQTYADAVRWLSRATFVSDDNVIHRNYGELRITLTAHLFAARRHVI